MEVLGEGLLAIGKTVPVSDTRVCGVLPAGAHCIDCGRACSVYAVQQAVYDDEVATCDSCGGLVKPGEAGGSGLC